MKRAGSSGPLDAIVAQVEHLRIAPDMGGFDWFGAHRSIAADAGSEAPGPVRRRALVNAVAGCLYENYYCTGGATPYADRAGHDSAPFSAFTRAILAANRTAIAWTEMKVLRVTQSAVVTSFGGIPVYTSRGSPLLRTVNGDEIPIAEESAFPGVVLSGAKSWSLSTSVGFIMFIGRREPTGRPPMQRVYWNLKPSGAAAFVASATDQFNRRRVPFRLKVLADAQLYDRRCDAGVMYLNLASEAACESIADTYRDIGHQLSDGVPALTFGIVPGLAVAENPPEGASFGMHRCELIAEACVQAAEGDGSADTRQAKIESTFNAAGLDLGNPHRLAADDDLYTRELSHLLSRTRRPRNVRTPAHPRPLPEDSWIGVAAEIGRQIVTEEFRHEDRSQWICGQISRSSDIAFSTRDCSLYGGAAGIGHFLAELALRTYSDEFAASAGRATRHALYKVKAEEGYGVYSGALGVAIIALRAAQTLDDSSLADQAGSLARSQVARPPGPCPDLLSGLAGEILALLILATQLTDSDFSRHALDLGQVLLERAERGDDGLSWPNEIAATSRNLTGLSHGTAGIAVALGELGRVTGEKSFSAAALEAVRYEDAVYSSVHRSWPDYRSVGEDTKPPVYPDLWCHGSAGIILSRMRLATLLGTCEVAAVVPDASDGLCASVERAPRDSGANFNLCHGIAGKAEVLTAASRWNGATDGWQHRAAVMADTCWRAGASSHARTGTWPCAPYIDDPSSSVAQVSATRICDSMIHLSHRYWLSIPRSGPTSQPSDKHPALRRVRTRGTPRSHAWRMSLPAQQSPGSGNAGGRDAAGPWRPVVGKSLRRLRPLEPGGPVQLDRLAEVSRHPAGCVEAHGRSADQLCQVRLKVLELGGTDLPLPLIAQLIEDRFTCAQHLEAERGDLKAHAAGVAGVCAACHVSAFLQDRDGFRRCLLGDGQAAAEF